MQVTPQQAYSHIKESLIQYLETQYKISNSKIYNERGLILREGDRVAQEPFIEATPTFSSSHFLSELESENPSIPSGLSELIRHGVPVDRHKLYDHQESALLRSFSDQSNLLVATGTGSGKTESFLLPILAKLLHEARAWETPTNTTLTSHYDERRERWLHTRRFENRPAALRSIILYPMNALVNDQLTRLRRILSLGNSPAWQRANLNGNLIHFGMYTSLTPIAGSWDENWRRDEITAFLQQVQSDWDGLPERHQELGGWPRPQASEMLTRWDMQFAPPDILVTNYSMLEYMLMRPIEDDIFDRTRDWLHNFDNSHFTLVLDEAHTYSGAKGTEVAHLIRRLKERLGLQQSPKFQAIATTASVPAGSDQLLKDFTSSLFGENSASFTLIRAKTEEVDSDNRHTDSVSFAAFAEFQNNFQISNPRNAIQKLAERFGVQHVDFANGDEVALYQILEDNPYIAWVRKRTGRNATPLSEIMNECWNTGPNSDQAELATAGLLAAGSYARADRNKGTPPLLSMRLHAFFRGVPGLWACMDPHCTACEQDEVRPVGKVYTEPRVWCDCGARVLEVFTCRHCGLMFLGGIPDSNIGSLWPWHDSLVSNTNNIDSFRIFAVEMPDEQSIASFRSFRSTLIADSNSPFIRPVFEITPSVDANGIVVSNFPSQCPRCQKFRQPGAEGREVIEPLRTKGVQSFATIVDESFRNQPPQNTLEPNLGKKALIFSDSRREASKLASDLKENHYNDLFRQCLYHVLYSCKTCQGTGIEKVSGTRPPMIGMPAEEEEITCRICSGSRLNPAPDSLSYDQLKNEILALQLSRGIDPSRQRINELFTSLQTNPVETMQKVELFFNADLLKEVTDEVYSFGPLGLGKWEIIPMHNSEPITNIGNFQYLSQDESYLLIQSAIRLLATERVVTSPEPRNPWDWGQDDENTDIVALNRRNTTQRLFASVDLDWRGKVIPFNVTQFRKLGRYIIAISNRLLLRGIIPDEVSRGNWVTAMDTLLWDTLRTFRILTPAGMSFQHGNRDLTPFGIRLNLFSLSPIVNDIVHQCTACKYVSSDALLNVCLRCGQITEEINPNSIQNYFRSTTLYATPTNNLSDPYPFKASEHTAQVSSIEARNEERWFQDIFHDSQNPLDLRVDALSVTTTMEMGIDIGSLLFVGLRNVPPTVANYQQRAGRAGRRGSALATVVTFAQARSHDQYYYERPKQIVSDPPKVPALNIANEVIARRHFRSLILQSFFTEHPVGDNRLFNIWGTVGNYVDSHINRRLEEFIRLNRRELISRAQSIVCNQLHRLIDRWLVELPRELGAFVETYDPNAQLFVALLNSGMLPKYAFPVDVVTLTIPIDNQRGIDNEFDSNESMQRDLKIAIAEYAPGAEITKQSNQRTFKYRSVGLHDPFEREPNYAGQGTIIECAECQNVLILDTSGVPIPRICGVCESTDLIRMQYIRPKGFTIDGAVPNGGRVPYNSIEGIERGSGVAPARLMMGENSFLSENRESFYEDRLFTLINVGDMVIANKGVDRNFPGFNICSDCGRELDPNSIERHRRPADVPPHTGWRRGPRKGTLCNLRPPYTSDKLVLAHKFHSEVLLLGVNLPLSLDAPFRESSGSALWYSFGTLIATAATRVLQIDPGEIKVGVRAVNRDHGRIHGEVYVFDDVPGGAGYSRAIKENLPEILQMALVLGQSCSNEECGGACYQCLFDYRNQNLHALLSRDLGFSLLNFVCNGMIPVLNKAIIDESANALVDYARSDYELGNSEIINGIYHPLTLTDRSGRRLAIRVIHPLSARPSNEELSEIQIETNFETRVFTSFDLLRRPFWVLNNLETPVWNQQNLVG